MRNATSKDESREAERKVENRAGGVSGILWVAAVSADRAVEDAKCEMRLADAATGMVPRDFQLSALNLPVSTISFRSRISDLAFLSQAGGGRRPANRAVEDAKCEMRDRKARAERRRGMSRAGGCPP